MSLESKIDRAGQSERRAKAKALARSLADHAAGSGWRAARGELFRIYNEWFIEVVTTVSLTDYRTFFALYLKPMAIDPIFWEICLLNENNGLPLSFRAQGAWVCRPPRFTMYEANDASDVESLAATTLNWSTQQLATIDNLTMQEYFEFLRAAPRGHPGAFLATEVTSLALMKRNSEALAMCEAARRRGDEGGFIFPDAHGKRTTFVERAVEFLQKRIADK
ncbi:hypothetical protein [Ancylobacter terrae]|uniref:hypothetical protein n=1 Tax=Ancylobacter sp. sgz301288 TaxID=3342077 RepID=UPI00385FC88C